MISNDKAALDELKNQLEPEEIINILKEFFPDIRYIETPSYIIFPTICHNEYQEEASMKLYYYFNTKLFRCYTECDDVFDIYELLRKILELRGRPAHFYEILNSITKNTDKIVGTKNEQLTYPTFDRFKKKNQNFQYETYPKNLVNFFTNVYYKGWLEEGITKEAMNRFNIKFSVRDDQVIIPHYDIDGNLIGIRGRNLDEEKIAIGKYVPVKIEGRYLSHPLSYNLYGLNIAKKAIKRKKIAILVEGEKSSLLSYSWYGDDSCVVATCGNKLNKFQVNLLIKLGVQEAILCYDRMDEGYKSKTPTYFNKLYSICEKYKNYMRWSFVYDGDCVLPYKAAPLDCGQQVFEKLLEKRIVVK